MVLQKIIASTKKRLKERKISHPLAEGSCRRLHEGRSFLHALAGKRHAFIAEYKNASPSEGQMGIHLSLEKTVALYNVHADAISVLTEEEHFQGTLEDLARASSLATIPVLRKDFIVDPYQILEALHYGADAVLLIADILDRESLQSLFQYALDRGLDVLLEAHSVPAFERALTLNPSILGINNRNLDDLTIDRGRTRELSGAVPPGTLVVSESGFLTPEHIEEIKPWARAFLIGTAIMKSGNPEETVKLISSVIHNERGGGEP
jgi:indole-3-glycerol phosphate synthase